MKKKRGVFEKEPGSGVWWIQYFDSDGRRRREMVGSRSAAIKLVEKRRTDAHAGVKMPENFRAKPVTFKELADIALTYSKTYKKSYYKDQLQMRALVAQFGDSVAEKIEPGEIKQWLHSRANRTVATRNRYLALMKMTYRVAKEYGKIKVNPTQEVKQKSEWNRECIVEITDAQESKLREVIKIPCNWRSLKSVYRPGCGSENSSFMRHGNVHISHAAEIRLPDSKSGKARNVTLNSRALAVLRNAETVFPWYWADILHTQGSALVRASVQECRVR